MSKVTDAIQIIKDDFKERFGVEVDISLTVYRTTNSNMNKDLAEYIAMQIASEIDGKVMHEAVKDKALAWSRVDNHKEGISVTGFYDLEQ